MLELRGVTVSYGSASPAVAGLDLTVGAGEVVALIGPSGAGKSTILRLACGLVLPEAGSVEVLGVDTARLGRRSQRAVRARIGTVQQDFALVGRLRVARNVAAGRLGRWGIATTVRSLVRPVALDEIIGCLDRVGIGEKLWDRADQLSGGQQQRAAIARVLFQDPELLLLDEPVSALDPARSVAVLSELVSATGDRQRAVIMSLHDAALAVAHCQRIIGLRDGVVQLDVPASEVTGAMLDELYALEGTTPSGGAGSG
jgi:phosphonate transport system ATP-binding protein